MANRIARREASRSQLKQEVLHCISALELASGIVSSYLGFKSQIALPLWGVYRRQRNQVHAAWSANNGIVEPEKLQIYNGMVDLSTITPLHTNTSRIEAIVLEELSISGRARRLMIALVQSIDTLDSLIESRNKQLESMREDNKHADYHTIFSLPRNGLSDARFGHNVEGISRYSDDIIYFGKLLCEDLEKYGKRRSDEFRRRFWGDIPRMSRLDWRLVDESLFPSDKEYASWHTSYYGMVPRTYGRRADKLVFLVRKAVRPIRKWFSQDNFRTDC